VPPAWDTYEAGEKQTPAAEHPQRTIGLEPASPTWGHQSAAVERHRGDRHLARAHDDGALVSGIMVSHDYGVAR
jgi:hypothetical protein